VRQAPGELKTQVIDIVAFAPSAAPLFVCYLIVPHLAGLRKPEMNGLSQQPQASDPGGLH
jgi:hypothetical protein